MRMLALLCLFVTLSACGVRPPASPTPLPPTTPLPTNALIVFNREGGVASTNLTLTIRLDHTAQLESSQSASSTELMIPADTFESLNTLIADPGFVALHFDNIINCADCYVYTFTALTPHGAKTVRADDVDLDVTLNLTVSPLLKKTIELLNEIVNSAPQPNSRE